MQDVDKAAPSEVVAFQASEAYVYSIPSATTVGHRAETWNVNEWLQQVRVAVVTRDEDAWVRLEDPESGDLFAECPIPTSVPLITAVEPVIDSSRYFVLKIVDRETSKHAFIGLGFRERGQASDFTTALHDHLRYVKKKHQAEELKIDYEEKLAERQRDEVQATSVADLSLPAGETMTLRVPKPPMPAGSRPTGPAAWTPTRPRINKAFSLLMDGEGNIVAGLSPRAAVDAPASSEGTSGGEECDAIAGAGEVVSPKAPARGLLLPRISGSVARAPRDDEWSEFQS